MTTLATDAFVGGPALGANWTDFDVGFTKSGGVATSPALQPNSSRYSGVAFPNDQWAMATIVGTAENTTDQGSGPAVRCQAGGSMIFAQGNTLETKIYERIGASGYNQRGADGPGITLGAILYIQIIGMAITLKLGGPAGSTLTTGTATTVLTGNAGIWGGGFNFPGNLDDFSAGDFLSGAAVINNPVGRRIVGYYET